MTNTMQMNGPTRKTLASQIDRLDSILDGLSEGLDQAVAQTVREAVGLAVEEAVQLGGQRPAGRAVHLHRVGHDSLL